MASPRRQPLNPARIQRAPGLVAGVPQSAVGAVSSREGSFINNAAHRNGVDYYAPTRVERPYPSESWTSFEPQTPQAGPMRRNHPNLEASRTYADEGRQRAAVDVQSLYGGRHSGADLGYADSLMSTQDFARTPAYSEVGTSSAAVASTVALAAARLAALPTSGSFGGRAPPTPQSWVSASNAQLGTPAATPSVEVEAHAEQVATYLHRQLNGMEESLQGTPQVAYSGVNADGRQPIDVALRAERALTAKLRSQLLLAESSMNSSPGAVIKAGAEAGIDAYKSLQKTLEAERKVAAQLRERLADAERKTNVPSPVGYDLPSDVQNDSTVANLKALLARSEQAEAESQKRITSAAMERSILQEAASEQCQRLEGALSNERDITVDLRHRLESADSELAALRQELESAQVEIERSRESAKLKMAESAASPIAANARGFQIPASMPQNGLSGEFANGLFAAVMSGDVAVLRETLTTAAKGCDTMRAVFRARNGDDQSLLHVAVQESREIAQFLVEELGTWVKRQEFMLELQRDFIEREVSAFVNCMDKQGHYPLQTFCARASCPNSDKELVVSLLQSHADLSTRDSEGRTPFILCAAHGNIDLMTLLLRGSRGSVLLDADDVFRTPLHWAAKNGHQDAVELLLKAKACASSITCEEKTAADEARRAGHNVIAKLLDKSSDGGRQGEDEGDDDELEQMRRMAGLFAGFSGNDD